MKANTREEKRRRFESGSSATVTTCAGEKTPNRQGTRTADIDTENIVTPRKRSCSTSIGDIASTGTSDHVASAGTSDHVASASDHESDDSDMEWDVPLWHHIQMNKRPDTIQLSLPTKTLPNILAKTTTTIKTSPRQEVKLVSAMVKSGGGIIGDMALSYSTVRRKRRSEVTSAAKKVRGSFECPEFLITHFDGKIIQLTNGVTEDRLAIVFSSPNVFKRQFAASPVIPNGTGAAQATALDEVIRTWGVGEAVVGQVFDTTASNTGCVRGAATRLETLLKKPIMWLACRHHVGELHVKWTYLACRGDEYIKSPENKLYKRLHDEWEQLLPIFTADPTVLVKWTYPADPDDWRCMKADTVLQWARHMMVHGSFRRGDHRELLELVVHYLGGVVLRPRATGAPVEGFKMRLPISTNQTRFMGTSIHEMKIAMLQGPALDCFSRRLTDIRPPMLLLSSSH